MLIFMISDFSNDDGFFLNKAVKSIKSINPAIDLNDC